MVPWWKQWLEQGQTRHLRIVFNSVPVDEGPMDDGWLLVPGRRSKTAQSVPSNTCFCEKQTNKKEFEFFGISPFPKVAKFKSSNFTHFQVREIYFRPL